VDRVVADVDAELLRLLLYLGLLHEEGDRLTLQLLVLGRARLRERALLRVVALLRALHQLLELILRDLLVADDGDVVRAEARGRRAAAARSEKRERGEAEKKESSHGKSAICSGFAHAAWRAASIASTSRSASAFLHAQFDGHAPRVAPPGRVKTLLSLLTLRPR